MAIIPPIYLLEPGFTLLVAVFEVTFELVSPFGEGFAKGAQAHVSADLHDDRIDH